MRRALGAVLVVLLCLAPSIGSPAEKTMPMSSSRFWQIVDASAAFEAIPAVQLQTLRSLLLGLSPAEISSFELAFRRETERAYTWDLWGAAYIVNGGASDDGFFYFRCWLVSKGQSVFEAALRDPDVLAEMSLGAGPDGVWELEAISYLASDAWGEKTGEDPWVEDSEFAVGEPTSVEGPGGEPFEDDETHFARRYPKLWEKYGKTPLPSR